MRQIEKANSHQSEEKSQAKLLDNSMETQKVTRALPLKNIEEIEVSEFSFTDITPMTQHYRLIREEREASTSVLLVDDQQFNLLALKGMCQELGVRSDSCKSGEEAIKLIKQKIKLGQPLYTLILFD